MFWLLLPLPIIWPLIAKVVWKHTIKWKETALHILAGVLVFSVVYATGLYSESFDTEVLNGQVTGKERQQVSCSHSYSCRCRPVRSCSFNVT